MGWAVAVTNIQRCILTASAWMPRTGRAVLPVSVGVEGETSWLVPDLCRELSRLLPSFLTYGETCIPSDAAPHGTITGASGQHVYGGLVVSLDVNQPQPEYVESNAKPDTSEVRLVLTQPVTTDYDDLDTFIGRRVAVTDALATLTGAIG